MKCYAHEILGQFLLQVSPLGPFVRDIQMCKCEQNWLKTKLLPSTMWLQCTHLKPAIVYRLGPNPKKQLKWM